MAKIQDNYVQEITFVDEIASGAAGCVVERINTSYHAKDRVGFVLQRVEYAIHNSDTWHASTTAAGNRILWGLTFFATAPETYGFDLVDEGLIDYNAIEEISFGAAASGALIRDPFVKDWTGLKGGGKLVHPSQFFHWIGTPVALPANVQITTRVLYFTVKLSDADYSDLWEARAMISGV